VFASWGSLGHVTVSEPGALVGFLGPRVYEQLYGEPFPAGIQTAENLHRHGVIDAVVSLPELRGTLDRALKVVAGDAEPPPAPPPPEPLPDVPAWDSVVASRRSDRPGVRHLLRYGCTEQVLLSGRTELGAPPARGGGEAATTLLALARFAGQPAVVLGQQRIVGGVASTVGPASLREARRGMALAAGLRLPLVLVIDTAGPALSADAEEDGLAGEIARCLAELVTLDTPTVSVLLGQGSGGPALAMVPADRVLAALHGWLAPLPPEGASAIVFRDTAHAAELAAAQGIRSADLLASGIVDAVVPEHPDAAEEPVEFSARLSVAIATELHALREIPDIERMATRLERHRRIGGGGEGRGAHPATCGNPRYCGMVGPTHSTISSRVISTTGGSRSTNRHQASPRIWVAISPDRQRDSPGGASVATSGCSCVPKICSIRCAASVLVALDLSRISSASAFSQRSRKWLTSDRPTCVRSSPVKSGNLKSNPAATANSSSLLPKYRITIAGSTPASAAIARIVAAWKPAAPNRSRAAARMAALVPSDVLLMPTIVGQRALTQRFAGDNREMPTSAIQSQAEPGRVSPADADEWIVVCLGFAVECGSVPPKPGCAGPVGRNGQCPRASRSSASEKSTIFAHRWS
jgi:acetyl-CoA carboxylase alpha subunit